MAGCERDASSPTPFLLILTCTRGFSVPNIQSAKKDLRKSRAAAVRNRAQRSALRTAVKKAKNGANADERLAAVSLLDRAARKGLIHRNTAARQKSKLARQAASA
jgi:small subunit ribosomal protein S20